MQEARYPRAFKVISSRVEAERGHWIVSLDVPKVLLDLVYLWDRQGHVKVTFTLHLLMGAPLRTLTASRI